MKITVSNIVFHISKIPQMLIKQMKKWILLVCINWYLTYPLTSLGLNITNSDSRNCRVLVFIIIIFLMFIFKRERETEHEQGRGKERGRHRIQSSSRLWVVSIEPDMGFEPTNREIMTWAEVGHSTDWATQVPHRVLLEVPHRPDSYSMSFHICFPNEFTLKLKINYLKS